MIVDFTVSNFRSIRDETTVSFHADSPGTHLQENIVYPAGDKIGVLKSVGIYGANASGKSNLLLAMEALRYIVCDSGSFKDGDSIKCYEPFRLNFETKNQPVRLEIEFITHNGIRYRYKVSFTKQRIVEEQLVTYQSGQPARLFLRSEAHTWKDIEFGTTFKGGKKRLPFFPNNSYLSKAGNSADSPQSVRDVFNYFRHNVVRVTHKHRLLVQSDVENADLLPQISVLLAAADTDVESVTMEERDGDSFEVPKDLPDELREAIRRDMKWKFIFSHTTELGKSEKFDKEDESDGTQRLFELAPLILDALRTGGVVLLDELESSMHPLMAELIIKLFNDPEANTTGAQLIFTTHNVQVMSSEQLRRDQIWFAEKENGASRYYSLADFDKKIVKPTSPFNLWYLEGRFNAVPKIDYRKIVNMLKASRVANAKEAE